jgi:hypothetical protein
MAKNKNQDASAPTDMATAAPAETTQPSAHERIDALEAKLESIIAKLRKHGMELFEGDDEEPEALDVVSQDEATTAS